MAITEISVDNSKIFAVLDNSFGTDKFLEFLGEMTALQLREYLRISEHSVVGVLIPSHSSWLVEAITAWQSTLSDQEKQDLADEANLDMSDVFDEIPEDFDPTVPLKNIPLWD